jgi:hypothetical protein
MLPIPAAAATRWMAEFWAKLIGVVLQHWVLLTTAWPDVRRSLWKAAGVVRDRVVMLIGALGDLDRLTEALVQIQAALAAVAEVTPRGRHPSSFQLLLNPGRLDW